jgi:hypothetical protein
MGGAVFWAIFREVTLPPGLITEYYSISLEM